MIVANTPMLSSSLARWFSVDKVNATAAAPPQEVAMSEPQWLMPMRHVLEFYCPKVASVGRASDMADLMLSI